MEQLHTERERRFIELAGQLADDFAERAARHDQEASFPHENYARLKETGYTALIVEEKLRAIAGQRLVVGGSGSEPDNAIMLMKPRTLARRVDGGWIVNGRKIFGTQSIATDFFFFEATWPEGPRGETVITCFVSPRETPGLVFKDDWNTMGMRATES